MQLARFIFFLLIGFYSQGIFASLPIQHWLTSSGVRVYFVENRELPILDISIDFGAGSSTDNANNSGRANMTRRLLSLGAGGLSEDQITKALADVGAQLGSHFDRDRAGLTLRTLSSDRERKQALDVFSRIIQFPVFPEDILERERARIIAGIKEAYTKPDYIAERTLMKMLYGSHPYGLPGSGEISSLETLQREDLEKFYRTHYTAKNAVVAIMGDVNRIEASELAETLTEKLPEDEAMTSLAPVQLPTAETKKIAHPASQSHIQLAYPGLRRQDPDYFPLLVGNYILGGGGFVSRLMEEIRQARGLAYSVYSYFAPFQEQGPFKIGLQTKKEQADEALGITRKVLMDFVVGGPTKKELIAAKQNIVGGFPLRLDSNKNILGYLAIIGFYNLPLTYLDDYIEAVEKVTVKQIKQAFQRRINPEGMVTVMVGINE
ncbi:MAG: peptidase M16 [Nitrosomonas sp.]|nr:MAG: peptidase M16 [Nitrosomonas sp.]